MLYIIKNNQFHSSNSIPDQLLQINPFKASRIKSGWLITSSDGKGWCMLNDEEYTVFQKLNSHPSAMRKMIREEKKDEFIAALVQCGLMKPMYGKMILTFDVEIDASPFYLTLILSARCNLSCRYCYLGIEIPARQHYLDATVARDIIRSAFNLPHNHIVIDFGEIALSISLFRELVLFAESLQRERPEKEVTLAIQTNGGGLKQSVLDFLEIHKVVVGLSLDGPNWLHNQVRMSPSGQGNHSCAERGVQEIIKRNMEHIVLCTISAANFRYPEDLVAYFLQLGISHFAFKPVIRRGSALDVWQTVGISLNEYKEFLNGVVNYAIKNRNWKALDANLTQNLFRLMDDPRGWTNRCPGGQCGAGLDMLVVNPYGYFYPCPRLTSLGKSTLFLGETFAKAIQTGMRLDTHIQGQQCASQTIVMGFAVCSRKKQW